MQSEYPLAGGSTQPFRRRRPTRPPPAAQPRVHSQDLWKRSDTSSINSDDPSPQLLTYATPKGTIANFSAGLAGLLGEKGIRVNSVAPGPIWTPPIPSTMPTEKVESFGKDTPLGRSGQPAELAAVHVLLASDEASYISGARIAVTGGAPIL